MFSHNRLSSHIFVGFIFFYLILIPASAWVRITPDYIQLSVWVHDETIAPLSETDIWWLSHRYGEEFIQALTAQEQRHLGAIINLFEETRWIFSGMIYGFWFEYTPASFAYDVIDEFQLGHNGLIAIGDPNLRLESIATAGSWLELTFRYSLSENQQKRRNLQYTSGVKRSTGFAETPLRDGIIGRILILEDSIQNAMYNYLKKVYISRPSFVKGEVFLQYPSRIILNEGSWRVRSDVYIKFFQIEFPD
ncbi:hypothetical protein PVA44_06055 [Entomospira nematocerorum]|uniref:Uncharacterized protein n=1 Tax=Entomospira nematocerorum TaxID=2719987 RepID=A0A968GAQ0_9SPIO|nr:hypothetical protein [Entomospira nematocera]NIZ46417.1 hypothetical protein [Entomospira nematocera]WDI33780.1 hypothetical protein PVA44_06055 [Entomospira nematocera]